MNSPTDSTLNDRLSQIESKIADRLSQIESKIADRLSQIDTRVITSSDSQLVTDVSDRSLDTSGGISDDIITGGNNNEVIRAGLGNDTIAGGFGADVFVFDTASEGIDTITDFSAAEGDKIQVSAAGFGVSPDNFSRFSFDNTTGALLFDNLQLASLPLDSGFTPTTDIIIV